jgi:hypothetical protein
MKTSSIKMWCGIFSPIWVVAGFFALLSQRGSGNMILDGLVIFGLWWGVALLLATLGITSRRLVGQIIGGLTILGFIGFLVVILNGGFSD